MPFPTDEQLQKEEMKGVLSTKLPKELWAIIHDLRRTLRGLSVSLTSRQNSRGTTLAKAVRNLEKDRQALGEVATCALKRLKWAIQQRFDVPEDNILIAILLDPRTFLSRTILGEELSKKQQAIERSYQ